MPAIEIPDRLPPATATAICHTKCLSSSSTGPAGTTTTTGLLPATVAQAAALWLDDTAEMAKPTGAEPVCCLLREKSRFWIT